MKINCEIMKKVNENDGNCLCKLNTKCPCKEFILESKCCCGLYEEDEIL